MIPPPWRPPARRHHVSPAEGIRGRASPRALLARRVEDAIAAGCRQLLTATGEAVPGDPQHSGHDIEWVGSRRTCLRENWVPG